MIAADRIGDAHPHDDVAEKRRVGDGGADVAKVAAGAKCQLVDADVQPVGGEQRRIGPAIGIRDR